MTLSAEMTRRPLWQPKPIEQVAALETLLASSIPLELRKVLRDRHEQITNPERGAAA